MTLLPLLDAGPVVLAHAAAALTAFGIGLVQFARRKGDAPHRAMGWVWVGLMALSSFGIHQLRQLGPFS